MNLPKGQAIGNIDLILHMSEKRLLRRVVPAIGSAQYRLTQPRVLEHLSELEAGVVTPLITVRQNFGTERYAVITMCHLHCL